MMDRTKELARNSLGTQLHVIEVWMPQIAGRKSCNLQCKHCYVPLGGYNAENHMSDDEYERVILNLMRDVAPFGGSWDVVFPGMEPLLPQNTPLLFSLVERAQAEGARSIGLATNGTLLCGDTLERVLESAISTVNVSLDGSKRVHNQQRGGEVFQKTTRNIAMLCARKSRKNVVTNTTIDRLNAREVGEIVRISADLGCTYAAFHPFEKVSGNLHGLELSATETADAMETAIIACEHSASSIVLEFETSTAGAFFELWSRGVFTGMEFVEDDAAVPFLRKEKCDGEILVNLAFYPHHFVRTVRVMGDGGLSSCRRMALRGWRSIGDLRKQTLEEIFRTPEVVEELDALWAEYLVSAAPYEKQIDDFFNVLEERR